VTRPLTVACVYKKGSGEFNGEYVRRLRRSVAKHCKAPYRFVCLGEELAFQFDRPGYWNKLELFRKGLFDGPVVYLDLDCLIVNDVTDIFEYPHEFTVLDNWLHPAQIASGFMAWDGREDLSYILDAYEGSSTRHKYGERAVKRGDQGLIQDVIRRPVTRISALFPDRILSYKLHVKPNNSVPRTASIVMFHGRPRPADLDWRLP